MELHTFSSLKKTFLPQYEGCMDAADSALVYFNPQVVEHKRLEMISKIDVLQGFGSPLTVANKTDEVLDFINGHATANSVLLMMSSGNFDGIHFEALGIHLLERLTGTK